MCSEIYICKSNTHKSFPYLFKIHWNAINNVSLSDIKGFNISNVIKLIRFEDGKEILDLISGTSVGKEKKKYLTNENRLSKPYIYSILLI